VFSCKSVYSNSLGDVETLSGEKPSGTQRSRRTRIFTLFILFYYVSGPR
jgi:hypothetical protein